MLPDVGRQVSSPVLVGRSRQLSVLDSALAAVRGSPSAVVVGGEAGIGKSRLVREFADRSRGAGARVLIGGCLELGADGLAVALLRSAEAALAGGDRDGGGNQLRRAAELAQRLGARPLSDETALLARRARIPLGQPGDAADPRAAPAQISEPDRLGLTARELEVLRLVAAGRSNREIAGELFISVKTASVHVSNILGKLGTATRGEAAATAYRLRLFDSFPQ
jgi:DNA-binding CsgD family transcriptional regulator